MNEQEFNRTHDKMCVAGEPYGDPPHLTGGPDYDASKPETGGYKESSYNRATKTYNGHPVTHGSCEKHNRVVVEGLKRARAQPGYMSAQQLQDRHDAHTRQHESEHGV